MKNRWAIVLAFVLASFAFPAFAGDFTATVDHNGVSAGEGFTLHLSLANTEAKGRPDISPLRPLFTIASQGQSSNIVDINGHVTNTTSWDLTLIPKTEGQVTIPAIPIETENGTLMTDPITMDISHASAALPGAKSKNVTLTAHASTLTPYKNQAVLYTVKIIARSDVSDLNVSDLAINNAAIEKQGEPKIYDATENGEPVKIIEIRYLVTPLASGKITIPAITLSGKMLDAAAPSADPLGQDLDDPFAMMRHMDNMFAGFDHFKAFSVASNTVPLDVKPEAVAMDPWLPLTSLTLHEDWDNAKAVRVGEPLTRKLTLTAIGTGGKQLPDLENQQNHSDFNVYADKPVASEHMTGNTVTGERVESYSLIPKEGKLELPAIKVPWWNLKTQQVEYAGLPAHTFDVLPAVGGSAHTAPVATTLQSQAVPQPQAQPIAPHVSKKESPLIYGVIGFLLCALLFLAAWAIRLQGRLKNLSKTDDNSKSAPIPVITGSKPPSLTSKNLSGVKTTEELAHYLHNYASEHLGIKKNASLEAAFAVLAASTPQREVADGIIKEILAALYAGKKVDIETLKSECRVLLASLKRPNNDNHALTEKLPKLNPG